MDLKKVGDLVANQLEETAVSEPVSAMLGLLKEYVNDKWANYRARQLVATLAEELKKDPTTGDTSRPIQTALQDLLAPERNQELLFEACRAATFAASKELGPRIIGMVLAPYLFRAGNPSNADDVMVIAAKELSDLELRQCSVLFKEALEQFRAQRGAPAHPQHPYAWHGPELTLRFQKRHFHVNLGSRLISLGLGLEHNSVVSGRPSNFDHLLVDVSEEYGRFTRYIDLATGIH
jgi:hypothetical protein